MIYGSICGKKENMNLKVVGRIAVALLLTNRNWHIQTSKCDIDS